jgi:hypothetical protein
MLKSISEKSNVQGKEGVVSAPKLLLRELTH